MLGVSPTSHAHKVDFKLEGKNLVYPFLNFICFRHSKTSLKTRISITFSYSKFENGDEDNNYLLATKQKTISEINKKILSLMRILSFKSMMIEELEVTAIDLSNQLTVDSIKNYSQAYSVIYATLKQFEDDGRLYIDICKNTKFNKANIKKRKTIIGLDFKESGKQRRESQVYLKFYSKTDEMSNKGKSQRGTKQAIRVEPTFRKNVLEKYGILSPADLTKEKIEKCLHDFFLELFTVCLEKELNSYIDILKKELSVKGTRQIRDNILRHQHLLIDVDMLNLIVTPEVLQISERQCRTHKNRIKESLALYEKDFEFERVYTGNFKRLKLLIKKGCKIDLAITAEEGRIKVYENSR
ncbi:MAG: hypothetical protein ACRC4T_08180 [Cetobacterium sp.]